MITKKQRNALDKEISAIEEILPRIATHVNYFNNMIQSTERNLKIIAKEISETSMLHYDTFSAIMSTFYNGMEAMNLCFSDTKEILRIEMKIAEILMVSTDILKDTYNILDKSENEQGKN